jgi:hypothetical protein
MFPYLLLSWASETPWAHSMVFGENVLEILPFFDKLFVVIWALL